MRDKLDELIFNCKEIYYIMELKLSSISDFWKNLAQGLMVTFWLVFCGFIYFNTEDYEAPEKEEVGEVQVSEAKKLLAQAYDLEDEGKAPEAFISLASYRNKNLDIADSETLGRIERLLGVLAEGAPTADISELYATEDLTEQQPIYTFEGVVSQVDEDAMYGLTHTVSTDGTRTLEQLEVTGLTDATVGSYVIFTGVPVFDSVSSPIKVQAFVLPPEELEEEVE